MSENRPAHWYETSVSKDAFENSNQASYIGSTTQPITRAFRGINHRQQSGNLPINRDLYGLTFFTRPLLNLSTDNIRFDRRLARFLQAEPASISNYIRCALDARLFYQNITCPLLDNNQAFIPILTNTLESISGWKDIAPPTYTSPEGVARESMSFVDGKSIDYSTYDITASFRNVLGDPITNLFEFWCHYMALAFEGIIVPYPQQWLQYEVDYNTRIYRLNLDPTKRYVTRITACGAAFPLNAPVGAAANYEHNNPLNMSNDRVSISFRAMGMISNDPILIQEFNDTVFMFNANMRPNVRNSVYRKIPPYALNLFNNTGYPHIDPATNELEWWVEIEYFHKTLGLNEAQIAELDATYQVGQHRDPRMANAL